MQNSNNNTMPEQGSHSNIAQSQNAPKDNQTNTHFEGTNTINPNLEKRGHLPEPHDKEQFPQKNAEYATGGADIIGHQQGKYPVDLSKQPTSADSKTNTHFEGTNTINPNFEKRGHLPEPHDKEQFPKENAKLAPNGAGSAGLIGKE